MATAVLTQARRMARRIRKPARRPPLLPLLLILVAGAMAVAPAVFAPADPLAISLRDKFKPPAWLAGGSTAHLLGTDSLGRDVLSRVVYGARASLTVAFFAVVFAGLIGLVVGMVSGYMGKWVDAVLMRVVDAAIAIPFLLVALIFAVTLGPGQRNLIIAITALGWAQYARIIRGEVLSVRQRDYVTAAVAVGVSTPRILMRHIFPNIAATFIVLLSLQIGAIVIAEAALSFLGAGISPPQPSWGSMVSEGRSGTVTSWWVSLSPGLAILLIVLAFNLVGDWLRDVLDPRMRQVR